MCYYFALTSPVLWKPFNDKLKKVIIVWAPGVDPGFFCRGVWNGPRKDGKIHPATGACFIPLYRPLAHCFLGAVGEGDPLPWIHPWWAWDLFYDMRSFSWAWDLSGEHKISPWTWNLSHEHEIAYKMDNFEVIFSVPDCVMMSQLPWISSLGYNGAI